MLLLIVVGRASLYNATHLTQLLPTMAPGAHAGSALRTTGGT
jgi:hypothetical protein